MFITSAQQQLRWATVATLDMGRKEGGILCLFRGELDPCLTQCGLSRTLLPYQVASSSIQPFGDNGPKTGACAPLGRAGSPSSTTSPGRRPISVPSGIPLNPAIWAQ